MKVFLLIVLSTFLNNISLSQKVYKLLEFGVPTYTITEGKIYKGEKLDISNLKYTYRNNKVYKDSSTQERDIVLSIEDGKVYSGANLIKDSLLFYVRGKEIFIRTKAGGFRKGGEVGNSVNETVLYTYLDAIESIALYFAIKVFQ